MKVLFVCSGNIGRSQMAMEYFKRLGIGTAASAGTRVTVPNEQIGNRDDAQNVLEAMREDSIDMAFNTRTTLTPEMLNDFDKVIVMAEPDRTPQWLSKSPKFAYWDIPNVNGMPIEQLRAVRDTIKAKVHSLVEQQNEDPVKNVFGKPTKDLLARPSQSHDGFHSSNAFCGAAGPEEMKHLQELIDTLTDNELAKLVDAVGIHFGSPTKDLERDVLEEVIDEADREDFYREYARLLQQRK